MMSGNSRVQCRSRCLTSFHVLRALCLRLAPPRLRPDAEVRVRTGGLHFGRDAACLPLAHGSRHSSSRQVRDGNYEPNCRP